MMIVIPKRCLLVLNMTVNISVFLKLEDDAYPKGWGVSKGKKKKGRARGYRLQMVGVSC